MIEKEDISLLELPKGTPMYLVQRDRIGHEISIEKVLYLGFERTSRRCSYEEPGKVRYYEYDQPEFKIFFESEGGKKITIKVDYISYWTGQRAFNTDEHLAYGKASWPYIDIYFTTSEKKLKAYLKQDDYLEKLKKHKDEINKSYNEVMSYVTG